MQTVDQKDQSKGKVKNEKRQKKPAERKIKDVHRKIRGTQGVVNEQDVPQNRTVEKALNAAERKRSPPEPNEREQKKKGRKKPPKKEEMLPMDLRSKKQRT